MNINLHIERLVLEGVAVDQPVLLEAALATELTRLLRGGHLPSLLRQSGAVPGVRAGRVTSAVDSATMGSELGRAVHASFMRDAVATRAT